MRIPPQFPEDERVRKNREELIERVQSHLAVVNWGFSLSFISLNSNEVIFDSEWCRFSVSLYGGRYPMPSEEELRIEYGRLHAPDTYPYMEWNGEQCRCWHDIRFLCLFFLEGYSPNEVEKDHALIPFFKEYERSDEWNQLYPAERIFRTQTLIWKRYGQRLFELFDLRHPELWEQYRQFLKEFYEHKNWQPLPLSKGETPRPHPWVIC
jgi:hypothetical protein